MLNSLLSNAERSVSVPEAALYAVLGFMVVFLGIAFLIFVIWAIGKYMSKNGEKKAAPKQGFPKKETERVEEIAVSDASDLSDEEEISDETVVLIMAALTAYYQTNKKKCEFTVKRIKRI